jgi:putative glutamine amidotransferase
MKPIIGITPSIGQFENRGDIFRMEVSYVEAVEAAGGVPILLPPSGADAADLLALVDGIIFSGGGDIRPDRYGDSEVHETTYGISDLRDDFEFRLLEAAMAADLPTLAICRGIQVLNVGLGGTLYQDVSLQPTAPVEHRQPWEVGSWENPIHPVALAPDSLAAEVIGDATVATNSAHHQTLKEIAPGLRVVGRADDGTVEVVEGVGKRFVLGVQWHPEKMFAVHPEQARLFARLVEEATAYRAQKSLGSVAAD